MKRYNEVDMKGRRFGHLVVLGKYLFVGKSGALFNKWVFHYDCGAILLRGIKEVLSGKVKSCGCRRFVGLAVARQANTTHGETGSRLYNTWNSMKKRCADKTNPNYGGRGIRACEIWQNSYESFRAWALSHGYTEYLEIDRIDNDGNYEPANCRWVTAKEQANNRRMRVCKFTGTRISVMQLARLHGLNYVRLFRALNCGFSLDDALALLKKSQRMRWGDM